MPSNPYDRYPKSGRWSDAGRDPIRPHGSNGKYSIQGPKPKSKGCATLALAMLGGVVTLVTAAGYGLVQVFA